MRLFYLTQNTLNLYCLYFPGSCGGLVIQDNWRVTWQKFVDKLFNLTVSLRAERKCQIFQLSAMLSSKNLINLYTFSCKLHDRNPIPYSSIIPYAWLSLSTLLQTLELSIPYIQRRFNP